jgi:Protein of unknown function (DUF3168)
LTPRLPDTKALTATYLRANADIAAIVAHRVGTRTPDTTDDPWIRIHQIGDATGFPLHLATVHLQLDCYGGSDRYATEGEASLLARTVREALDAMPAGEHEGAVVTAVRFGAMPDVPDPDFDPPRKRIPLDAFITLHPAP